MVFTSLPSYLDPLNWHQQQPPAGGVGLGGGEHEISQLPPSLLPPPPPPERGRITKLPPPPEAATKCPRCESTNTKFCYFNNYSLSQPRHFCKTCRRYWTRGGALRNVPVGGGCRRNKKSTTKSSISSRGNYSRSKSPTTSSTSNNNIINNINNSNAPISPNSCTTDILGHHTRLSQFPILPPMHHYEGGDLGLTFGGGNGTELINLGHDSNYPSSKFTQFPFLEATNGGIVYGEGPSSYRENHHHHDEQHDQGLNLSRNFLGISGNEQFMSGGFMSGFTSSSTTTTTTTTTHIL